ncbi:MAG: hypothetical protein H0W08_27590 [Acidobacteria bacterium]|nr:hypothetical protein [Acidobacteriota bacterium]
MRPGRWFIVALFVSPASPAAAQDVPADYAAFMKVTERTGDFKDGVLKVNLPLY